MPAALDWHRRRTFHHSDFPPERIATERNESVSVCLPAREEARTIGAIVETLAELQDRGVLDQVLVVDAGSGDGTADIAAGAGAEVVQQSSLLPELGEVLGKGDAMWRALSVLRGDVVCFLDADSEDFGPHFACGMIGPLACSRDIAFVKGFYRRPFRFGTASAAEGGGRVTELTARPLLNLFYPELAAFRQPLAGEVAARRDLLERIPFSTGYAVEIAMLLDAHAAAGLDALAQVDLDVRQNRHQPLDRLAPMAYAVLQAVADRLEREGRLDASGGDNFLAPAGTGFEPLTVPIVERPPMESVRAAT
jgi:glucosyl-3-phosphoglycerate synthase